MSNSKIGVKCQSGTIPQFRELCAKHPIAFGLIGNAVNLGIAETIRNICPDALITIRAQADNWSLDAGVVDFCNRSMAIAEPFQRSGLIDFLATPNEPPQLTPELARTLNAQMVQCADIYKRNGYKTLAYAFSVGQPNYEFWPLLTDGIVASEGWVDLHQYGAPNLYRDAEDLALRHRKARAAMSPAAQAILKIGIGEAFIDLGIGRPADGEPTRGGYRALRNPTDDDSWWIRNMTQQADWWDAELAKDDYVVFSTMYGYAMLPPWDEDNLKFDVAGVDTDRAFYIAWQRAGKAVIPSPVPPTGEHMQVYQPYAFPKQLSDVAWQGVEGKPTPAQPFYRIQPSAGLLTGVSAFVQIAVIDLHGNPVAGAKVVNAFGDGHGEVQQTDASGVAQFNFGPSSAFTPPAPPPLTFFVADDSAYRDDDKFIHYKYQLSDIVKGGDTNGAHTEGSCVMVAQIVMPDATSRDDAIRLRAYPAKALMIPVYCKECALQAQGRKRTLGAVLTDEYYVTFAGEQYVAQGFALGIVATIVGHYADSDFFTVQW